MRGITRRLTALLLALSLLTGLLTVTAAAEEGTGTGYVTDGLVLQLDANNNTGSGHDDKADKWVNLADTQEAVDVSATNLSWGQDVYGKAYLNFNDGYIKLPEAVRKAIADVDDNGFTVEFLMDDYANGNGKTAPGGGMIRNIMTLTGTDAWIEAQEGKGGTPNDCFVIFQSASVVNFRTCALDSNKGWDAFGGAGETYAKAAGGSIDNVTQACVYEPNQKNAWYQDGALVSQSGPNVGTKKVNVDGYRTIGTEASSWQTEDKPQVLFGAASDVVNLREFYGKVRAIRVYDRALTAGELIQNAAMDAQNFQPAKDADGYAADGLVLRLDALNNTGDGHDDKATVWKDLASGAEIDLNGNTWEQNSLNINGYIKLPEAVRQAIASGEFTVEFLLDDYAKASSGCANVMTLTGSDEWIAKRVATGEKVGTKNDNFVIYQNGWEDTINFKVNSVSHPRAQVTTGAIGGKTNGLTFQTGSETRWYQDGTQVSVSGKTYPEAPNVASWDGSTPQVLFGAAVDVVKDRSFAAKVQAIRVYDRVLTVEELAGNAALDAQRYPSAAALSDLAQSAWEAVVGNTADLGSNTSLAGLQTYAENCMTSEAKASLAVAVADAGNGTYTFTYGAKNSGETVAQHTFYVDCEYTLDMSQMDTDAQKVLLNDVVQYKGSGSIEVKWNDTAKALNYKGTRNGNPVSHLYFPVYSSGDAYVFETELSFVSGLTDWSTMVFGADRFVEHLQYAFWGQRKASDNGAEFVRFQDPSKNTNWAVGHQNIPFSKVLETLGEKWEDTYTQNGDTYQVSDKLKMKVVVYNGMMYALIDGVQVLAVGANGLLASDLNGVFGFNTAGTSMNIHKLSVRPITEENKETELAGLKLIFNPVDSYKVDLYEPDTDVNTAPIVMQTATEAVRNVSGETKRPSALIFTVKAEEGVLNAYDGEKLLGTFQELYNANHAKANVGVRIALGDKDTANAVAAFAKEHSVGNLWAISSDVELLDIVTDAAPTARGVVDFTGDTVRGPGNIKYDFSGGDGTIDSKVGGDYAINAKRSFEYVTYPGGYSALTWAQVYDIVFAQGYRTVLLPESAVTKEHVNFLQGSLVYTMVETSANTERQFYDLIVAGVNGILSASYETNIATLEGELFAADGGNILIRGGSVVGHRGDMGYHVKGQMTLPENSVESIVSAAQSGASSVEFDMYMTTDGELVTNHNASVAGYFVYADDCPLTADQRVSDSVPITQRAWYGDLEYLVSTYNKSIPMQRLRDLYEAVDTEYPELRLHHEIKDGRIETLNRTIEMMDQYGLRDRSDMMCFTKSVVAYTNSMGISSQYLASVSKYTDVDRAYTMETQYRDVNSTWHAQWSDITNSYTNTEFLEEMKHFGQTAYPWPTSDEAVMGAYYVQGYQGFTTNIPHHTDKYIKELLPVVDQSTGAISGRILTIADHETGPASKSDYVGADYTVVTLPDYLDQWWVKQGISGPNEYSVTEVEIIAVAGSPIIDNSAKTAFGQDGDLIAIRYKHQLKGGSYYVYSESFAPAARAVDKIEVTTPPSVQNYIQNAKGEAVTVDPFGAKLLVTYNDGSTTTVDVTYDMLSYDGSKLGDQYVTVTYQGKTAAFLINIQSYSTGKHIITVLAGAGGSVTPSGSVYVADQDSLSVAIQADPGYRILSVAVDGQDMGAIGSYTFEKVSGDHTLVASFAKIGGGSSGTTPSKPAKPAFTDVPADSVYKPAIEWAVEKGITAGKTDTTFDPNGGCTRGQAVTFLWRLAGSPEPKSGTMPFTDVDLSSYCGQAVLWAVENGITKGVSETRFQPETAVKRGEAVTFLWRMAGSPAAKGGAMPFTDVAAGSYCGQAVLWAAETGVTAGVSPTRFQPEAAVTRGQIVTFIYRAETL